MAAGRNLGAELSDSLPPPRALGRKVIGMRPAGSLPQGYPAHRVVDVALRDGSTVRVRPALLEDLDSLEALFARLSANSVRMRFHGSTSPSRAMLKRFADVDYE